MGERWLAVIRRDNDTAKRYAKKSPFRESMRNCESGIRLCDMRECASAINDVIFRHVEIMQPL